MNKTEGIKPCVARFFFGGSGRGAGSATSDFLGLPLFFATFMTGSKVQT